MLSIKTLEARIEAISECIGHLDLEWTDDPHEREAAVWLQGVLKQLENKTVDKLIYHKSLNSLNPPFNGFSQKNA